MRKIRVILLALVISTLSVFPTTVKADRDDYSTVQVTGSLTPNESVIPEENEESLLEEKNTIIKANKLPKTGEKNNNVLIFFGIVNFWIIFMIYCRGLLKRVN